MNKNKVRCPWCGDKDFYVDYHDKEWGVPVHDDRLLFEFLILESAQAGLSWSTILQRREGYRKAFDNFDVKKVAKYDEAKIQKLMVDERIIRNQLKIRSAIKNAQVFIAIQKEFGSFDAYLWGFVNGKPLQHNIKTTKDVPVRTDISDKISRDLKKRGMSFVGSTIMYAFMQAVGMVNDHLDTCFRKKEVQNL